MCRRGRIVVGSLSLFLDPISLHAPAMEKLRVLDVGLHVWSTFELIIADQLIFWCLLPKSQQRTAVVWACSDL